jgi:hypothetical protein
MWRRELVTSKIKASTLHLGLSAIAFGVVLYFILVHWYPQPWFPIDGGWQGVRIMIWVDLVIGPALTFLAYNPSKTRLALTVDFTVIGVLQAIAFTWGVYAVHGQRPVAVAYFNGGFYSFQQQSLHDQGRTVADLAEFDSRKPALVYAQEPRSVAEGLEVLELMRRHDVTTYEAFQLLHPLKSHLEEVWERSEALAAMLWADPVQAARLERILQKHPGLARDDLRFAWFLGRYEEATLVMNKEGEVLGSVAYVQPPGKPDEQSSQR